MLTISKAFTCLCLLCLCGNREYPGSFQNKLVSSFFKCCVIIFCSYPNWSEVEKAQTNPLNYLLHVAVMLPFIKVFIILLLLVGIGNTLVTLKTNLQPLLSIEFLGIFFFWPNWRWEEDLFWRVQKGGPHCDISP